MSRYTTRTFKCKTCENYWSDLITAEDREKKNYPSCPLCESTDVIEIFSAPKVLRASYPDGTKRKGFEDLKKAAKLECEMTDKPLSERGEYEKEIKELKKL